MKRNALAAVTLAALAFWGLPAPAQETNATLDASTQKLETIEVTGSRIPRAQIEGPAPVVTITAQDIQRDGFADVADIMSSLNQNLGALDNNQYTGGFSVGAQAVDLRGLHSHIGSQIFDTGGFEAAGLIAVDYNRVTILSPAALDDIAASG